MSTTNLLLKKKVLLFDLNPNQIKEGKYVIFYGAKVVGILSSGYPKLLDGVWVSSDYGKHFRMIPTEQELTNSSVRDTFLSRSGKIQAFSYYYYDWNDPINKGKLKSGYYYSYNWGKSWLHKDTMPIKNTGLYSILISDSGKYHYLLFPSEIFRSDDFGKTFKQIPSPERMNLNFNSKRRIDRSGKQIVLSDFGYCNYSFDFGNTWKKGPNANYSGRPYDYLYITENNKCIVYQGAYNVRCIGESNDLGNTWLLLYLYASDSFISMDIPKNSTGLCFGLNLNGEIMISNDFGKTLKNTGAVLSNKESDGSYSTMSSSYSGKVLIANIRKSQYEDNIAYSNDFGKTWKLYHLDSVGTSLIGAFVYIMYINVT